MKLIQQTPNCSDFDVAMERNATPAFRVLLPEWIRGLGIRHTGLFHVIPGRWANTATGMEGSFGDGEQIEISVNVSTKSTAIEARLRITNVSKSPLSDLWANICASLNHLPGNPGWSNGTFLPGVALDRDIQGRYWYEKVAPHRLMALTDSGWIAMHPNPEDPSVDKVPLYSFTASPESETHACAVESPDGGLFFYQAWNSPCRWCIPCPGNACMHLEPFLCSDLPAGRSVAIEGEIGMASGDLKSLQSHIGSLLTRAKK